MQNFFGRFILILILLALIAVIAISWYASNLALTPQPYSLAPEFKVLAVEGFTSAPTGRVTLEIGNTHNEFSDASIQGHYNLLYHDENGNEAYGRLGAIIEEQPDSVTRELRLAYGKPPQVGSEARVDVFYYRRNPKEDLGLNYQELELQGEAGIIKAWWLPNSPEANVDTGSATAVPMEELAPNPSKTAVMMLHGRRRGALPETLRMMPAIAQLGYPILAMSYRNHSGSVETGRYHYGATEWRDAALGLEFLREQGIEKVVIFAISMGGSLTMELLENYPATAPETIGLIFDSPMVDVRSVLARGGARNGLPSFLMPSILWLTAKRGQLDWQALNHVESIGTYNIPLLLIAATNDQTIPITRLDAFAAKAQDAQILSNYYRYDGAGHVTIWNSDPNKYAQWLQWFLSSYAPIATVDSE